jgi:lysophospholipase
LTASFQAPPGFGWGHFNDVNGARIRFGHAKAPGTARGIAVIVTGFREPAEKYFEVANEMLAQNLDVWVMDWRGQGGSARYLDDLPMRMHSTGFNAQIDALHFFMRNIVRPERPAALLAHSMGGHIGLRYVAEHPGVFSCVAISALMANIVTAPTPRWVARFISRLMVLAGRGAGYIFGGHDWTADHDVFDNNRLTSDPARHAVQTALYTDNPLLQAGAATFGWLDAAFRSIAILNGESYLGSIATPVLMGIAGADRVVDIPAQERVARLLPQARVVHIPAARHEIWMERDDLRIVWKDAVVEFLNAYLPQG